MPNSNQNPTPNDWAYHSALVHDKLERLQEAVEDLRRIQALDREEAAKQRLENSMAIQEVRNRLDTEIKVIYAKAIGFGTAVGVLVSTVLPLLEKYL